MAPETKKRYAAERVADTCNRIEGVPVSKHAQELSRQWVHGKRKITCTYQRAARYEIMEWEVAERFGKWRNVPEYSETALEG